MKDHRTVCPDKKSHALSFLVLIAAVLAVAVLLSSVMR